MAIGTIQAKSCFLYSHTLDGRRRALVLGIVHILRSQRGREQASEFMASHAIYNKALQLSEKVLFLQTLLSVNSVPLLTDLEKVLEISWCSESKQTSLVSAQAQGVCSGFPECKCLSFVF